jgi:hypothetical protein
VSLGRAAADELRGSFGSYYLALNPDYEYVTYQQEQMVPALEAVEAGEIKRLMLLIPPGHSKSQLVSIDFAAWFMGRQPSRDLIGLSYSSQLANHFGTQVRNRLTNPLHKELFPRSGLSQDSRAKNRFRTLAGGHFHSVGFNGSVFGKRADGIIIDDPLKNEQEARSQSEGRFRFYRGIVKSRLRPGGWIVICTTRLCVGDFVHKILEDEGIQQLLAA